MVQLDRQINTLLVKVIHLKHQIEMEVLKVWQVNRKLLLKAEISQNNQQNQINKIGKVV